MTEWRGLLGASAIGSTYDWLSFDPGDTLLQSRSDGIRSLTFMPEFSPGLGFSIALGGVGRHLLAMAPGLARLSLPDQEVRWDAMSEEPAMVVDAWTSGLSLATLLGVLYELRPNLLLNTNVGHHIEVFDETNELEVDPESIVAHGFTFALGLEWWP